MPELHGGANSYGLTPKENVYGSQKRLAWIRSHLRPGDRILEFGCGTGCMISLPLAAEGRDIVGVDFHGPSIEFGRSVLRQEGLDESRLTTDEVTSLPGGFDVIIASEVLEHIETRDMSDLLALLRGKLRRGGRLLVTVPNGYGWFEIEQTLWRAGVDRAFAIMRVETILGRIRHAVLGRHADDPYPNTLADDVSPHVQRFTRRSLKRLLEREGFEVQTEVGSVMFCGPITHTLFKGFGPFLMLNGLLGGQIPALASGFYVVAVASSPGGESYSNGDTTIGQ